MTDTQAKAWFHAFVTAVYTFPLIGAVISDGFLGKYRTIMSLSIVYCLGHLALAIDDTRLGLAIGLGLIAMGSGGIKPCVSAHVGDQFGRSNAYLLERVFVWFYLAINVGASISSLLTPWLLEVAGPHVAFGVPGALMLIATWVFWLGRRRFVHVPAGGKRYFSELRRPQTLRALARLMSIYLFVAVFWSLYEQTGSSWVLQAEHMDRTFFGIEWLPAQVQAVNPILIVIFLPLFGYVVYPVLERVVPLTPLRKIGAGFVLTALTFLLSAWIAAEIESGATPSIGWQLAAYALLTAAEVLVSPTCLEFSYTQAPRVLKSLVMSLYLLSVALGNEFTSVVNYLIQGPDGTSRITNVTYFLFFAATMAIATLAFVGLSRRYQVRSYLQEEE
jgi:POT family proton-dependent oligopeptide transporter